MASLSTLASPLIVYCSGNAWTNPIGTDRHIAERLATKQRVLWVDPPLPVRPRNARELAAPRLRQLDTSLWRLTPKSPPGVTRAGIREIAAWRSRHAIRGAAKSLGGVVGAVVVSSLDDYLNVCDAPRRIFFATDDFQAGAHLMGLSLQWVRRREPAQVAAATTVVSVSEQLADRWRREGHNVVVIPNGCDTDRFADTDTAPLPSDVRLSGPIAGVIGQLNDRIDLSLLEAVADRGFSLLLVGPIKDPIDRPRLRSLYTRDNVQWIDQRPFAEIPGYLRAIAVGLTPYADTEFNRGSSPLKTLEYLAAGRCVVATDLPAARTLETRHISIAANRDEFVDCVEQRLTDADDETLRSDRRAIAERHSWNRRAAEFQQLVTGLSDPPESSTSAVG